MKWLTALIGGGAISLALLSSPAFATVHGWCGGGATSLCPDNGTNSPWGDNPPNPFGFTSSPPNETGILSIAVLVPDNENAGLGDRFEVLDDALRAHQPVAAAIKGPGAAE